MAELMYHCNECGKETALKKYVATGTTETMANSMTFSITAGELLLKCGHKLTFGSEDVPIPSGSKE